MQPTRRAPAARSSTPGSRRARRRPLGRHGPCGWRPPRDSRSRCCSGRQVARRGTSIDHRARRSVTPATQPSRGELNRKRNGGRERSARDPHPLEPPRSALCGKDLDDRHRSALATMLELGRELNRLGERQVEMSDEGLMGDSIGSPGIRCERLQPITGTKWPPGHWMSGPDRTRRGAAQSEPTTEAMSMRSHSARGLP